MFGEPRETQVPFIAILERRDIQNKTQQFRFVSDE
jgi:hypothetical protein